MTTVLAALDSSLAGHPVLLAARSLARVLGARVRAITVVNGSDESTVNIAEAVGVPLEVVSGPVVESLVEAARAEDVAAVVIGARATPAGRRPLGSTAFAVASALLKPVVVVPPDGRVSPEWRRVLVPLEGTVSTSLAPRSLVEIARAASLDVVVLHVHEEDVIPAFTDDPYHEHEAWSREFLARYCPWGIGAVRLERRVGRAEDLVPAVAETLGCDVIALGWTQQLSPGRAPVVRAALARSHVPVMLVPVRLVEDGDRADPSPVSIGSEEE